MQAPKKLTWFISLIVGAVAIVSYFVFIPFVSLHLFWFLGAAWLLLILGTIFKGL